MPALLVTEERAPLATPPQLPAEQAVTEAILVPLAQVALQARRAPAETAAPMVALATTGRR